MKRIEHDDRRRFIGGSDAAAVLGLGGTFQGHTVTPLDIYLRKVAEEREPTDPDRERFFRRRKRQEPVVAESLAEEFGLEITRLSTDLAPNRYQDPDHDFLAAEIDFEFVPNERLIEAYPVLSPFAGMTLNGEIKTVHPFKAREWGEQGSEEVPIHYEVQAVHGCGVARRPACLMVAMFGVDEIECFPIVPEGEVRDDIRSKLVGFWENHVVPRVPPPPVNTDDIKHLYGKVGGRPAVLPPDVVSTLGKIFELRATKTATEEAIDDLELVLQMEIYRQWGVIDDPVDNAVLLDQDGVVVGRWPREQRSSIDSKRLRIELPEVAEKFTRTGFHRVLRKPPKPKR